ncbi:MAG: MarR family winged helix-turn-helix transcriptional regulator [Cetobacterium sp.]|uniref:MarR family winged helix-turn-helix transcriptional regulator n=1 Tax=Cetobacterium sp. TaxID=2071632 RepID=UPI003EE5F00A
MNIGKIISIIHRKRQHFIKKQIKNLNLDIAISDYPIVLIVNAKGKMGTTEIAHDYAMTKAQVSQSTKKLEELGYITQSRNEKYRNRVDIDITPKGKILAEKLRDIQKEWQESNVKNLDSEAISNLYQVLESIALATDSEDI